MTKEDISRKEINGKVLEEVKENIEILGETEKRVFITQAK